MSLAAVVRFASVLEPVHLVKQEAVESDLTLYRRGSLWLLPPLEPDPPGVPLLVDHQWGQRVGTVPGQAWDLGHVDGDGLRYAGPEHRHSRDCPEGGNRATARHRKAREMLIEQHRPRSREW